MKAFSPRQLAEIENTGYFYIRSGSDHRYIAVWVVVVDGRVLIRSWNDKPTGWFRAFQKDPRGSIRLGTKAAPVEVPVRAKKVRGAKLIAAMDDAYAAKYTSKANLKYVKGFRTRKRQATSVELVPV